jgi:N-acetyl-D-muramate 6-phosphate phosphatase
LASREFKAIFFDLDGTLVDIHGPLYIAARKALRDIGHQSDLTPEQYREALNRNEVWLGVPENRRPEYIQLAFAYFMTEIDKTERLEVLPHVAETLSELKRRRYATAVVTSRPGEARRLIEKLAMVGLAAYLDHVVTQPTSSMKDLLDKTDLLKQTAMRVSVLPPACLYVGDEPRDIMAAQQAGFGGAVAVATGAASFSHLKNHPLHRPDHVINSMAELLGLLEAMRQGASQRVANLCPKRSRAFAWSSFPASTLCHFWLRRWRRSRSPISELKLSRSSRRGSARKSVSSGLSATIGAIWRRAGSICF